MSYTNKQASLLAAAARTTEVSGLKQSLERTEEELGLVKKKLEDKKGMLKTFVLKLARTNSCA